MDNNSPTRANLEVAATALVGANGVQMIAELARLLDEAETRGRNSPLTSQAWCDAYKRGYDDAIKDSTWFDANNKVEGEWIDWPAQTTEVFVADEDLRDPIVNAHVEGDDYTDMSVQSENRSPISDREAYEALEQHYGYYGE